MGGRQCARTRKGRFSFHEVVPAANQTKGVHDEDTSSTDSVAVGPGVGNPETVVQIAGLIVIRQGRAIDLGAIENVKVGFVAEDGFGMLSQRLKHGQRPFAVPGKATRATQVYQFCQRSAHRSSGGILEALLRRLNGLEGCHGPQLVGHHLLA